MPDGNAEPAVIEGAGIAFLDPDGKILFLKRGNGGDYPMFWCLPGGTAEPGEEPIETARREAIEEVGDCPGYDTRLLSDINADGIHFTTFLQDVDEAFEPEINGEHVDWMWADLDHLPEPMHPGVLRSFQKLGLDIQERDPDGKFASSGSGSGESEEEESPTMRALRESREQAEAVKKSGILKGSASTFGKSGGYGSSSEPKDMKHYVGGVAQPGFKIPPPPAPKTVKIGERYEIPKRPAEDEWREEDHPRAENGQFGSGGGGKTEKPKRESRVQREERERNERISERQKERAAEFESFKKEAEGWVSKNKDTNKADAERYLTQVEGLSHQEVNAAMRQVRPKNLEVGDFTQPHWPLSTLRDQAWFNRLDGENQSKLTAMREKAKQVKPMLDEGMADIAKSLPGATVITAPIKGIARSSMKISADYGGDASKIKDLVRRTIETKSARDANEICRQIKERYQTVGKDRNAFDPNEPEPVDGYRDAKFNVVIDGMVCEIQVNLPEMLAAKNGPGHKLYEERSILERNERRADGSMSPEANARRDALNAQMKALYQPAWERAQAALAGDRAFSIRSTKSLRNTGEPSRLAYSILNCRGGNTSQAEQSGNLPTLPIETGTPSTSSSSNMTTSTDCIAHRTGEIKPKERLGMDAYFGDRDV